jgi:hypothetical protein
MPVSAKQNARGRESPALMELNVGPNFRCSSLALLCGLSMSSAFAAGAAPSGENRATVAAPHAQPACHAPPTVPSGLSSSKQTPTSIVLQWNASTTDPNCVVSYRLLLEGGRTISTTAARLTVKALLPDTDYSFAIIATNQFGSSSVSAPISVRTSGGKSREPRRLASELMRPGTHRLHDVSAAATKV